MTPNEYYGLYFKKYAAIGRVRPPRMTVEENMKSYDPADITLLKGFNSKFVNRHPMDGSMYKNV